MTQWILLLVLTAEILLVIFWKYEEIRGIHKKTNHETDLRLTYKRYKELYPTSKLSYREYKQLQARSAYKRAVPSTKIKRMVR